MSSFLEAKFFPWFAPSYTFILRFLWFERLMSIPLSVLQDDAHAGLPWKGRMPKSDDNKTPMLQLWYAYVKSHVWESWSFQRGHCFETNGIETIENSKHAQEAAQCLRLWLFAEALPAENLLTTRCTGSCPWMPPRCTLLWLDMKFCLIRVMQGSVAHYVAEKRGRRTYLHLPAKLPNIVAGKYYLRYTLQGVRVGILNMFESNPLRHPAHFGIARLLVQASFAWLEFSMGLFSHLDHQ